MKRQGFACFLILLLASASLDDAWASTTPEIDDDVLAAENNEYLSLPQNPQPTGRQLILPQPALRPGVNGDLCFAGLAPEAPPAATAPPEILYQFMSLQC
jgi:hypothetical protein